MKLTLIDHKSNYVNYAQCFLLTAKSKAVCKILTPAGVLRKVYILVH